VSGWRALAVGLLVLALPAVLVAGGQHQHGQPPPGGAAPDETAPPRSRRVTMEELHRTGGVPRGWKFRLPAGDAARGRQLFADLECYTCHTVAGENFPEAGRQARQVGPPLTGVGAHHPAEYIAESILDPDAVIVTGPGYTGPDGRSIMPSYADSLTVTQWLDLVAYLKSLTGGESHPHRAARAGDYRVRVAFAEQSGSAAEPGHHPPASSPPAGGGHGHGAPATPHRRYLMAFITDAETDEPVPYLPVSATLHGTTGAGPTVKLEPKLGTAGFHYGADVTPPRELRRITLTIDPPTVKVVGPRRFGSPVKAVIEWEPAGR
jgi:mono/diheme cytochrome c family protein